jgi:hypothetical protein
MLEKIVDPLAEEIRGNGENHTTRNVLIGSPVLFGRWRRVGHVAHRGEKRNAYTVLARKHEGKRRLGRPRYRWRII